MTLRVDQTEATPTIGNHAEDHKATNQQVNQNTTDIAALEIKTVPAGGTSGQVLTKHSNTDYDLDWSSPAGGSGGAGSFVWGEIGGDIGNQTDLQAEFDLKAVDTTVVHLTGDQTVAGIKTFSSSPVAPTPVAAPQVAIKSYVDAVAAGLTNAKVAAQLATTTALATNTYANGTAGVGATLTATANGALTIDSVSPAVNDRLIIKDEATASHNGIYLVTATGDGSHPYVLTRATDADSSSDLLGASIFALSGTVNSGNGFLQTSPGPITVGTTGLVFGQYSGAGQIDAGDGLTKTGNTLNVVAGTGISVAPDAVLVDFSVVASKSFAIAMAVAL